MTAPIEYKSLLKRVAVRLTRAEAMAVLETLLLLPPQRRTAVLRPLPDQALWAIAEEWWWRAHGGQEEPEAAPDGMPWRLWAIVAGRGFGKTRAGAEWVWARAREDGAHRIALVAATLDEVRRVMIEGESGLLAVARGGEAPRWIASRGLLLFPSGAEAHAFSAERPESLRGPQHHFAWCDELAKWPGLAGTGLAKANAALDNLLLGLRLGGRPRTIVTTTPRPGPLLRRILAMPRCAVTHGRTADNPHLPPDFLAAMDALFGRTRLGRQELEGLLLDEHDGALWTRALIERARAPAGAALPAMARVVLGLDPPASTGGDSCGIVVCGRDEHGIAWVLADLTAGGLSPEAWARRVADAAARYGATRIVAEKNQGGDMIASVLRAVDASLPVVLVAATRSKAARAEPIALRFETGDARLAGAFPELEDQLCALTWSGYQGPGSPDRADALVWAMTELFDRAPPPPRLTRL
jgi:phage terminase large subunit-like protein